MLQVTVEHDAIQFVDPERPKAGAFAVTFQRTLRIPDDSRTYPLPPGLGCFPVYRVADYADRVPEHWREHGGVFIPMYQAEAMWISFDARDWRPNAIKVAVGNVNAVSGDPWSERLMAGPEQDYLVCPPQLWLDGINAGKDMIRQFVAMPLGLGVTVEAQVTGDETVGGLQLVVYEAKPGRFPDEPPPGFREAAGVAFAAAPALAAAPGVEMGLGAGGQMRQKIYPDPHGRDTWDEANHGRVFVHIVNSLAFSAITGQPAPPTPVSARTYTDYGLPWFDLYDEVLGDVAAPEKLNQVSSLGKLLGPQLQGESIDVPPGQVKKLPVQPAPNDVGDGDW